MCVGWAWAGRGLGVSWAGAGLGWERREARELGCYTVGPESERLNLYGQSMRVMRSAWIWFACAVLVLSWTALLGVIRLFDRDELRLRTGRWFRRLGRLLAKVNPWRIQISGLEHLKLDQTYVIVSNHQSLADIPVLSHLRVDAKWLGKAELFRIPFAGWMMRMAGDVPVDRSDKRQGARAILQCARYLRRGCSVVFFPEGTRSKDGAVQAFNPGPFHLAIREKVPVLPLVVEGTGDALPRSTWLFGSETNIQLRVLEAVPVVGRTVDGAGALSDEVRQRIVDELARLRRAAR